MSKPETIPDIIAEMCGGPIPQHRHDRVLLRHYADRIETAYKREFGDTQKMREALKLASYFLHEHNMGAVRTRDGSAICCWDVAKVVDVALAAPPRNCDRYTTHNDAMQSFEVFVREQGKLGFINPYTEAFKWLFAPATKQEGGNNEQ